MSKSVKILLGILCISPILFWLIFMFQSPINQQAIPQDRLFEPTDLYSGILGELVIFGIIIGVALSIFFAIKSFMGKGVPEKQKNLWGVLLLFGNLFVLPFYWFLFIWKANK